MTAILRRIDPRTGDVLETVEMPSGVGISGLESDGQRSVLLRGRQERVSATRAAASTFRLQWFGPSAASVTAMPEWMRRFATCWNRAELGEGKLISSSGAWPDPDTGRRPPSLELS
jgi:hypothetical protein